MVLIKAIVLLFFLFTGMLLYLRNDQIVTVDFYIYSAQLPLSLWLVLFLFIGAFLGVVASLPRVFFSRRIFPSRNSRKNTGKNTDIVRT